MATPILFEVTDGTSRSVSRIGECRDIPICGRILMALTALCDPLRAVVAGVTNAGMVIGDRRPGRGARMTRGARAYGRDKVSRRLRRNDVSSVATIVVPIVTAVTRFERDYRMVHRRIREGSARVLVAGITIDFDACFDNRNVGFRIRVVRYIDHARSAGCMTAGSLATARHSGVIEGRGRGESGRRMACTAILIRRYVRERAIGCFANGDAVVVAVHAQLPDHFGTTVIEGSAGKRRRRRRIAGMAAQAITRRRHVVLNLPGRGQPIMTSRTSQAVVHASGIQCRVVESADEAAACLMALLTLIRRHRVDRAFADRRGGIARGVAVHARLAFYCSVLMVDRVGFQEVARGRVTSIALPAILIHGRMHRVARMALGEIGRVVV